MRFKMLVRYVLFTKVAFPGEGGWTHLPTKNNQEQGPSLVGEV